MDDMTPSQRPPVVNALEAPGQDLRQPAADRLAASREQIDRSRRLFHHVRRVPILTPDGDIHPNGATYRLAAQPIPLVDRTEVLAAIRTSFVVEGVRLLTVTGPAGVGKTRVAVEVAAQLASKFSDGVVAVDLSYVHEPAMVIPALAHALGVSHTSAVPLMVRLRTFLADRRLLLLLDNFEHVLSAANRLGDLLIGCPDLAMLVTSRTPLHLRWEHVLRIAPLPVPDLTRLPPLDELAKVPAVALFLERARARGADFALNEERAPLVAQLVVHLNGLPLALELAAARLDTLPLPLLARQLRDRLQVLKAPLPDAPTRQRSLEAAIGWSYDLLNPEEQRLFRHLGVFAGLVTLDAITAVVAAIGTSTRVAGDDRVDEARGLPELLSLAEQSLLLPPRPAHVDWQQGGVEEEADDGEDEEAGPAFGMLETVREYAAERLAVAGEMEAARRAHAQFFLELAERADAQLRGPHQRAWFFRMEREHDNLRAALHWLLDREDDPAARVSGLRLASALGYFWWLRGYHAEGAHWLDEALDRVQHGGEEAGEDPAGATVRTVALCWAGALLTLRGDLERARTRLEEARSCAEQPQDPSGIARALTFLGQRAVYATDAERERAVPLLEEALRVARALGESHHVGVALFFLGVATHARGRATEAAMHYAEALGLFEAAGDERVAGAVHVELGVIAGQQDDLRSALRHLRDVLEASGRLRDRWLLSLGARAVLAVVGDGASAKVDQGDLVGRARLVGAADALRQATGGGRVPWEPTGADRTATALRAPLTEAEWETAYREGRSLPAKEVVQLALHLLDEAASFPSCAQTSLSVAQMTPRAAAGRDQLTSREVEILKLVGQGLANKAIARQLSISPSTVNYHLTAIFNKLVVDTRAQAVAVAMRRGLL
ncbi:MAG TPA: LuxR C-terminal-related transcriptional regulator [Ktedonobacterales bacterium]|nr:LuxR C-terminal-related transcriptional regulator [Ktedonobacterales bacterium]